MFFGQEHSNPAVWTSIQAAHNAAKIVRASAHKYAVYIVEAYDEQMNLIGYVLFISGDDAGNVATKGYIAALMARHDIPAVFEDREMAKGGHRSVDVANVPGWKDTPVYDELPKEGPACIHVKWG